jgi:phage recombination protein Bet
MPRKKADEAQIPQQEGEVMSKELVVKNDRSEAIVWNQDQVQLIKDTICKGATDNELKLFLHVSQKTGLDPFVRQIYSIGRWDSRLGKEVHQTMVSIDGARLVAERSGKYKGQKGPFWCGSDGVWREAWLDKNPPAGAKVGVLKDGFEEPLWGVATWNQYVQTNKSGAPTAMWAKMAPVMLAKCAEMLALRKAFPQDLSGLYEQSEMDQAINPQEETKPQAPKIDPEHEKQVVLILELSAEATSGFNKDQKSLFMKNFWGVQNLTDLKKKTLAELKEISKKIDLHIQEQYAAMNSEENITIEDIPWGE